MPVVEKEIPAGQEIKTYDELVVGLPKENLTILDLARKMAGATKRSPLPSGATAKSDGKNSRRSEEHTSELQSRLHLVCRLLLEKKKKPTYTRNDYTYLGTIIVLLPFGHAQRASVHLLPITPIYSLSHCVSIAHTMPTAAPHMR